MFEPYLKSFYIRSTDPTQIKILKVSDGQKCMGPSRLTPTAPTYLDIHSGHLGPACFCSWARGCSSQKHLLRKPG